MPRNARLPLVVLLLVSACGPTSSPATTPVRATLTVAPATTTFTLAPSSTATVIPYATPAWFHEAIVYEVFVRSFADSDGDGIGDLDGVTQRLDYIQSLGATALWLMPIYPSPSPHGYDVTDYFAVNPDYGTLQDLQELVSAAHARGLRLILDFVPSHLSNQHPFFQEAYGNPASTYSEWFLWTNDAHTTYASFAGNQTMPRFNHRNPAVGEYLTEAALFWLDLDSDGDYRDGVDGFRVDNVIFPPSEFFQALRQQVKQANPNTVLLGEAWVQSVSDLAGYFPGQFDALFDFPLYAVLEGNQDFNRDGLLAGNGHPALLTSTLGDETERFSADSMALRLLSNHDTNRIASEVGRDPARERLAAALLASLSGPVMVYYGEEVGMLGEKGGPPAWDNYRREPMDWYASQDGPGQTTWFRPADRWNRPLDGISVEEQESDAGSLLNYYRHALDLRLDHPALRQGDFEILTVQSSGRGAWAFARTSDSEVVVAVFNFASTELDVTMEDFPIVSPQLIDLLSGANFPGSRSSSTYPLRLPAATAVLLAAAE